MTMKEQKKYNENRKKKQKLQQNLKNDKKF